MTVYNSLKEVKALLKEVGVEVDGITDELTHTVLLVLILKELKIMNKCNNINKGSIYRNK